MIPITINKLFLFVTESCNLRCLHCHKRLPPAAPKPAMMREETARHIARRIFDDHGSCAFVQFFGGEPTLNMGAIRAFVAETERLRDEGRIHRLPHFGIVTNGAARQASGLARFCREHRIGITISIDGPRPIHDLLRPSADGRGSFDDAMQLVEAVRKFGVPLTIESVYTARHIDQQCSIVDLLEFARLLGADKIVLHTAHPPAAAGLCPFDEGHFDRLLENHVEAVRWWFNALINEHAPIIDVYFKDLLQTLLQGSTAGIGLCPGGINDFSIAPDGSVYACHLLYGRPDFRLGNILSDDALAEENRLPRSVRELPRCADCFASHWCQPCGALNHGWGDPRQPAEKECRLRRTVVQTIGELALAHLPVPENQASGILRQAVSAARQQCQPELSASPV